MKNLYYYQVTDHLGNNICQCGSEDDARMMISLGGKNSRMFVRCQFLPPDTVSTTAEYVEDNTLALEPSESVPFNPQ